MIETQLHAALFDTMDATANTYLMNEVTTYKQTPHILGKPEQVTRTLLHVIPV